MANINLNDALKEIATEKNIPQEMLIKAVQAALAVAYRKANPDSEGEDIEVRLEEESGEFRVYSRSVVMDSEDLEFPDRQCTLEEARESDPDAQPGDILEEDVTPSDFGRIAAQTVKQVVNQKLKEAERDLIFEEFKSKIGQIVNGRVQRIEHRNGNGNVYVEFEKADAVIQYKDQIPGELFRINDHIKALIIDVKPSTKGPQIILSRSHPRFVEMLFKQNVPEISEGIVEIKSSSREPGIRAKISVLSNDSNVDPVGSCVGMKGSRIKSVVDELNGEKIDIVRYSENPEEYVTNALSPAKVMSVRVAEDRKSALTIVAKSQLSLAIGKEGQNVKLASKLTGIKIDIKTEEDLERMEAAKAAE